MKHPSEEKPRPENVTDLHALRSVQAADKVFKAPPKPKNTRGKNEGPKHHNPFKGMKI